MANETNIDTLSLEISSQADKAISSISKLTNELNQLKAGVGAYAKNLSVVSTSIQKLGNLTGSISGIDNLNTKLKGLTSTVSKLSKNFKVDLEFGSTGKKATEFEKNVKQALALTNVDMKPVIDNITKGLNLTPEARKRVQSIAGDLTSAFAESFDGTNVSWNEDSMKGVEALSRALEDNVRIVNKANEENANFLETLKGYKVYADSNLIGQLGSDFEDLQKKFGIFTKDASKGHPVQDIPSDFPNFGVFDMFDPNDSANESAIVYALTEAIDDVVNKAKAKQKYLSLKDFIEIGGNADETKEAISQDFNTILSGITDGLKANFEKIQNMDSVEGTYSRIIDGIANSFQGLAKVPDVSENITNLVSSIGRLGNLGEKASVSADGLKSISDTVVGFANALSGSGITPEISTFVDGLARMAQSASKVPNVVRNVSKAIVSAGDAAVKAEAPLEAFGKALDEAMSKKSEGEGKDKPKTFKEWVKQFKEDLEVDKMKILPDFSNLFPHFEGASAVINKIGASLKGVAGGAVPVFIGAVKAIPSAFKTLKSVAQTAFTTLRKGFNTLRGIVAKVSSAFRTLKGAVGKIGSLFNSGKSGSDGFGSSLKHGFLTILKYTLGLRSLFVAVNRLRGAFMEGLGNLAHYSSGVNNQLSQIASGIATFKNAMATAFAPLLSVVVPVFSAIIGYANAAANSIAQFFASLTGKSTYISAKKMNVDYAKSLDKVGKSGDNAKKGTDKAKKSAEEYKRTILGFDQINKLDDPNSKNSNGGSGTGGANGTGIDYGSMFETKDVDSKISDFAQKIKEAWKKADFTEIGKILGNKVKDALDKIPWDTKIKPMAQKFGKSFATLINGFVSVGGLGTTIGTTIAEAINTGIVGLNSFAKNLKWHEVGQFIADGLNGAMRTIDWSTAITTTGLIGNGIAKALNRVITPETFGNVGNTIANAFNTVINGAAGLIGNANWNQYGLSIASFLNNTFRTMDLNKASSTLANAVNGVLNMIQTAVNNTDWETTKKKLSDAFKIFIKKVKWKDIGKLIEKSASTALNFIFDAIGKVKWDKVGESVAKFLGSIPWSKALTTLGVAGANLMIGLFNGITKKLASTDFSKIGNTIGKAFENIKWGTLLVATGRFVITSLANAITLAVSVMGTIGGDIVEGLKNGITNAFNGIKTWVQEHITDKFVDAIKSLFQINSSSKVTEEIGGFLSEGLLNGLKDKWDDVLDWAKGLKTSFTNAMGTAGDWLKNMFSGNTKNTTQNIDLNFTTNTKFDDLTKPFKGKTLETDVKGKKLIDGIPSGDKTLDNFKATLKTRTDSISNKTLDNFKATLSSKEDKIGSKTLGGFKATVSNFSNGIKDKDRKLGGFKATISSFNNRIKDTDRKLGGFKATITSFTDSITSTAKKLLGFSGKKATGGIYTGGQWHDVAKYAVGNDNINSGQMFIARENGLPEMVGTIGNHSAVVNNSQIVSSIAAGVYSATLSAMSQVSGMAQRQQDPIFNVVVKTQNDEVLARAVTRGNRTLRQRYSSVD